MENQIQNPETTINATEAPVADVHSSILQRAKEQGLKVTDDGRIQLPGVVKNAVTKETKPKAEKAKPEPKEYKGVTSDIFSTGDMLEDIIDGLTAINAARKTNPNFEKSTYKLSTYKKELRVAFDTVKANDLVKAIPEDFQENYDNSGFLIPDGKEFFSITIA